MSKNSELSEQPPWADQFLEALRESGVVARAARKIGVPRRTVYNLRERACSFDAAIRETSEIIIEDAESVKAG